jgi:hypothetical protein
MPEFRIYIEGGGPPGSGRSYLRTGFNDFLREFRGRARQRGIAWNVILCGGRSETIRDYARACEDHADAWNILLVDSDGPVSRPPAEHLGRQIGQGAFRPTSPDLCHLMVQTMEAWLLVDRPALRKFYGKGLQEGVFPKRPAEEIGHDQIVDLLVQATRKSSQGWYHKIRHGSRILPLLDTTTVRRACPHCDAFLKCIEGLTARSPNGD